MNLDKLKELEDVEAFLAGTQPVVFTVADSKTQRYQWLERTLVKWRYHRRPRREKGLLFAFMSCVSGYSDAQLKRLIKQHRDTGYITWQPAKRNGFQRRYTDADIRRLAMMDKLHNWPSGAVIKKLCERAFHLFNDPVYEALSGISVAHLYRLRQTTCYQRQSLHHQKTQPTRVNIGERKKPFPKGEPGYIRIDTVHQGDQDKEKGVYHINAVDEVTQFQVLASVVAISEQFLLPVLEQLLTQFPFAVKGFHSDNGSEYVNYSVAKLLKKLHIEFTKSRARHSNDNALAEGKNAAVVRKLYGHAHIARHWANAINELNQNEVYRYINFHRPCYFAVTKTDEKGKQRKSYPYSSMMTPFEKLQSIEKVEEYLKPEISLKQLEDFAGQMTDNEAACQLQQARQTLFKTINEQMKQSA